MKEYHRATSSQLIHLLAANVAEIFIPVPYISRLSEKLKPGRILVVSGDTATNAARFAINLTVDTPQDELSNIALHFNVRFDEKQVVINTMKNGEWGKEERIWNPYKPGDKFDIRIRAHENHFETIIEQKVYEYKHRLPLGSIRFLNIRGDCMLSAVRWSGGTYAIPFERAFPKGHFGIGERLYLSGVPKDNFSFNLLAQNGANLFHFNPRFNERQIVRNSRRYGQWETEEREGEFPFKKNIGFDLVFRNEPYVMQVCLFRVHQQFCYCTETHAYLRL
ncbi:hypothetical protein AB6A40_005848 [Gnathostoma spinigerum]|uniref:Galectin n=1 Tax=Gnathostoma spinigerum TaxID=75299 RepID=A0ABD6EGN6_9BILA